MHKILFALLFSCLFNISFAVTDTVTNTNNSGIGSLREAIDSSNHGDTIRFHPNLIAGGSDSVVLSSQITIRKSIRIIGLINSLDTLYISGGNLTGIFKVFISNVTLDSLIIKNTLSGSGGAIFQGYSSDSLFIKNSVFLNCNSNGSGGAIFSGNSLFVENSLISNCSAISNGGGICSANKLLNIVGSTIQSCNASNGGGIYGSLTLKVNNSVIKNNTVNGNGGGIHARDGLYGNVKIHIKNSEISNNTIVNISNGSNGGGVYAFGRYVKIKIDSSKITNNKADFKGGGIFSYGEYTDSILIDNSSVSYNISDWNSRGGGIYTETNSGSSSHVYLYINMSKVNNNASSEGAGINSASISSIINIIKSELSENGTASAPGAGIYTSASSSAAATCLINIVNSQINKNFGGGIRAVSDIQEIMIDSSIISENQGRYAGIHASNYSRGYSNVRVYNSLISNNSTYISSGTGGAGAGIYSKDSLIIVNSTIDNNKALSGGGAGANSPNMIIKNSTISNNYAKYGYGGLYSYNLETYYTTIANNHADLQTGALGTVNYHCLNTTIANNTGLYAGGIQVYDSLFINNSIIVLNNSSNLLSVQHSIDLLYSNGYNILNNLSIHSGINIDITDSVNINDALINLDTLKYNGGFTKTIIPLFPSIVINSGDTSDLTDAQNRPVLGIRDRGAAENNCQILSYETIYSCSSLTRKGKTYSKSGSYTEVIFDSVGCDSVIKLNLIIDTNRTIRKTSCLPFLWYGVVHSVTGVYLQPLSSSSPCAGVDTLFFTRLNPSNKVVVINSCGPYTHTGGVIFSSTGTYMDTSINVLGCDSISTIILTVRSINKLISQTSGVNLRSNEPSATYQWLDCNNGYSIITGETNQTFTATINGSYSVQITKNSCIDTSACYLVNSVGLSENEINTGISIYPNPNNGTFTLQFEKKQQITSLFISDINGRIIKQITPQKVSQYEINFEGASGIYFLNLVSENDSRTIKIIKN